MAEQRTDMALVRTRLAYARTIISLLGFGLGIWLKLEAFVNGLKTPSSWVHLISILIMFAVVVAAGYCFYQFTTLKRVYEKGLD